MDNPYPGNPGPHAWDNPDGNPNLPTHAMAAPVTLPSLSAALMPIMEPAALFSYQNERPVNNTSYGETFIGAHEPLSAGNPWQFHGAGSSSSNTLAPMGGHHEDFTGLANLSTNFAGGEIAPMEPQKSYASLVAAPGVNAGQDYQHQMAQPMAQVPPYPFVVREITNHTWYDNGQGVLEPTPAGSNSQHVAPPADMTMSWHTQSSQHQSNQYKADMEAPSDAHINQFNASTNWQGPATGTDQVMAQGEQMGQFSGMYSQSSATGDPQMGQPTYTEPYAAYTATTAGQQLMAPWPNGGPHMTGAGGQHTGELANMTPVPATTQDGQMALLFDMAAHQSRSPVIPHSTPGYIAANPAAKPKSSTGISKSTWLREVEHDGRIRLHLEQGTMRYFSDVGRVWFRAAESWEYWRMTAERPPIGKAPRPDLRVGDTVIEFTEANIGLLIKMFEYLRKFKETLAQKWREDNPTRHMLHTPYPYESQCTWCPRSEHCKEKAGNELRVIVFSDAHYKRDGFHMHPSSKGDYMTKRLLLARALLGTWGEVLSEYWDVGKAEWVAKQRMDLAFAEVENLYMELGKFLKRLEQSDWQMLYGDMPGHHAGVQQAESTGELRKIKAVPANGPSLGYNDASPNHPEEGRVAAQGPARVGWKNPSVQPANRPKRAISPPGPSVAPSTKKRALAARAKKGNTTNARTPLPLTRPFGSGSAE